MVDHLRPADRLRSTDRSAGRSGRGFGFMLEVVAVVLVASGSADAGGSGARRTTVTVWATAPAVSAYGGATYGGWTPTTGAFVTEQHEVDLPGGTVGSGEIRIAGVPSTLDPASVNLRDLTDPAGLAISEQRFLPGARTPTEMIGRHVGSAITIVTTKGEVAGVLRAVDEQTLVVEVGTGDQRRLQVMRRDGYVLDVRLPGTAVDRPSLAWRLAARKPGKHTVELSYRAEGMTWSADYLAVLDESGTSADFSAWASIKNTTGASFDDARLTLVDGATTLQALSANAYLMLPAPRAVPTRYEIAKPIRLGTGESVQVELFPARVAAKVRPVVSYEALVDQSPSYQQFPNTECSQNSASISPGHAEIAIELDLPTTAGVPAGRVRVFQRKPNGNVDVISEDQLRVTANTARLRLGLDTEITGERHAISCDYDEQKRTIRETIEVKIASKAKRPLDVVIREYMWRTPLYKLSDPNWKRPASGQAEEKAFRLAPGGKQSWTYTVVYTWT